MVTGYVCSGPYYPITICLYVCITSLSALLLLLPRPICIGVLLDIVQLDRCTAYRRRVKCAAHCAQAAALIAGSRFSKQVSLVPTLVVATFYFIGHLSCFLSFRVGGSLVYCHSNFLAIFQGLRVQLKRGNINLGPRRSSLYLLNQKFTSWPYLEIFPHTITQFGETF